MRHSLRLLSSLLLVVLSAAALAQEQYRSRVYIDNDPSPTESISLGIGELEKKLATFDDAATRASAERHLARHYAGQQDYAKAVTMYEDALKRGGMSAEATQQMTGELSRIYLLQNNYESAGQLLQKYLTAKPSSDPQTYILLAQIQYKRKQYVAVADALDKAIALQKPPSKELLQTVIGIYYTIGNYEKSAATMKQMLAMDPENPELWQQLTSIYLKMGNRRQALNVMALAWQKQIPFRQQDIMLLCDLYTANNIPERGARLLEEAIAQQRIKPDAQLNDRLFRLWMQAGDKDKAEAALAKTVSVSNDPDMQLHMAQLQMEKEDWQTMQQSVMQACKKPLPDRLVSRANLLLGVSQLKLGETEKARRSFINATVMGGANDKAGQWLRFMKAEPPSKSEASSIDGPCNTKAGTSAIASLFSSSDDDAKPAEIKPAKAATTTAVPTTATPVTGNPDAQPATMIATAAVSTPVPAQDSKPAGIVIPVTTKTAPTQKLFYAEYTMPVADMENDIVQKAIKMGITIVKGGGTIDGPMHLMIMTPMESKPEKITFRMGFPVKGNPAATGQYRSMTDKGFKCAYRQYEGTREGVPAAWEKLYRDTLANGHELSGQSRQIADKDSTVGQTIYKMELQIGIK